VKPKSKTTGVYLAVALSAAAVAALIFLPAVSVEAVYPAERAKRAFSDRVWSRVVGFFRGAAANAENVRLKREISALALLAGDVDRLEIENARLRRALGYSARVAENWLSAPVLSRGGGSAAVHRTIRVGRGTLDGVSEGGIVVAPEGLVGRVSSVTAHTAEVRLLSDPTMMVHCEVESTSALRMRGVLVGSDDVFTLKYLTGSKIAQAHSRVLTSGKGGVFPKGLMVGYFSEVVSDRNETGQPEALVRPAVDFDLLEDVFIRRAQ